MRKLAIVPMIVLAAACAAENEADSAAEKLAESKDAAVDTAETEGAAADMAAAATETADCPVLDSRNWSAWVNAMPSVGGGKSLHVAGEADLPTPGYAISWTLGPADRAMPPAQHLKLEAAPPDGMVAQVVTAEQVKYEGDALYPEYRAIIISCGDTHLAEITEVMDVQ